ncbi:type VI secretion system-associated FHA domain protein TagH [Teredinibacter turnerae]|uniref:type VI secretion system-associated FHA domain protein TagH n=1 Tax=Teredinibacter turnerae TaxID=2426 RepID=UPI000372EA3C|nr:type VI secretion system-associated FHA domain protein TagH [Teredinibacter turnerae]
MVLKVEVLQSPQGVAMAEASKSISEQGGSLGRGENNTWVLDDPERFLSSRHCEFDCDGNTYYLTDVSTNGTFVNGSPEPLGRGVRVALSGGDTIEIGEYQFRVVLEGDESHSIPLESAAGAASLDPFASPASPFDQPVASIPSDLDDPLAEFGSGLSSGSGLLPESDLTSNETDPLAALDKAAADPFSASPSDPFEIPGNSDFGTESFPYGQNTYSDNSDPLSGSFDAPKSSGAGLIPEDWEDDLLGADPFPPFDEPPKPTTPLVTATDELVVKRPNPRPTPRPRPTESNPRRDLSQPNRVIRKAPGPAKTEKRTPLDRSTANDTVEPAAVPRNKPGRSQARASDAAINSALFESMGLDVSQLSEEEQQEVACAVGELMPVVVEGMMRVLRSRASIKNEFRMSVTTMQPIENNPLKFSADKAEALDIMFVRKSKAYKAPVAAFSEGFDAIAEHQVAIIAGIRAAFTKMVEHFDPVALEQQFDKQNKGVNIPGMQKARYWNSYTAYFQGFMDNMEQSFQNLFGDEFVRAYEDQLFKLMTARNITEK